MDVLFFKSLNTKNSQSINIIFVIVTVIHTKLRISVDLWYIRFASSTAQTSARKACSFFISVSTFAQAQVEPIVVHTLR